jgi:hypothetical protein
MISTGVLCSTYECAGSKSANSYALKCVNTYGSPPRISCYVRSVVRGANNIYILTQLCYSLPSQNHL